MQGAVVQVEKAVLALAATAGQQRTASSDLGPLASLTSGSSSNNSSKVEAQPDSLDMLTASEWPGINPEHVLQSPSQCRTLWRHFVSDSELSVQQALATQQAQRVRLSSCSACASECCDLERALLVASQTNHPQGMAAMSQG